MTDGDARPDLPASVVLVGAGKMGGAMLEGWLAIGLDGERVTILDPNPSAELTAFAASRKLALNPPLAGSPPAEVVVLAIKPQMLDQAVAAVSGLIGPRTVLLSVLAGKTIADLRQRFPACKAIVRGMPNLPAAVRRGVTAVFAEPGVGKHQRALADTLLKGIGKVEWLPAEDMIDAVTAVSGSGPAYVFHLVEALAEAGVAAGLPADLSARLARATIEGAGELLFTSPESPARLRQNVTSPGGTTAAALEILMADNGLTALMRRAVAAAKARAEQLSG
jgi:pyrroline-5-carboxylate reductase